MSRAGYPQLRLTPFVQSSSTLNPICQALPSECSMKPDPGTVYIHAKHPISLSQNQLPQNVNSGDKTGDTTSPCNVEQLPPINVNLQMYSSGNCSHVVVPEEEKIEPCNIGPQYESTPMLNDAGCGLCMEPIRTARFVPINYVEKVCAIIPHNYYTPSPYKLDDRTTYQTFFMPKDMEKTESFRPKGKYTVSSDPLRGPSEYNYSYVPYDVAPYRKPPWAKPEQYFGVSAVLDGTTTYKSTFQIPYGSPAKIIRPHSYFDATRGPLDDQTTYRTQFVPYNHKKLCSLKPEQVYAGTCRQPFNGTTMYRASYPPPCLTPKTKICKPNDFKRTRDYEFEEDTSYSHAYRPYAFKKCTPVIQKDCFMYKNQKPQYPSQ